MTIFFPIVFSLIAGVMFSVRSGLNFKTKPVMFGVGILAVILTTVNTLNLSLQYAGGL